MRVAVYVYTRDRFSAGCTRHERFNAVEFTLRKLPLSLLGEFQLLLHHSVGADVINDCVCRWGRHKGEFSSDTSGTRRTAEDSTQPFNSVPGHVVAPATHFLPRRRLFNVYYSKHCKQLDGSLYTVGKFHWFILAFTGRRMMQDRNFCINNSNPPQN